jgi:hypothetical protein
MPIVTKTSTSVTPRRSIIATTLLRNGKDQRLAALGLALAHDDARESFASCGYATIVESGFLVSGLVVADRSRTRNQIINAGAIAHTRTVGHVDAGQFIAARAVGDPFDETTIKTSGFATASNPSRPIIPGNG